MKTNQTRISLAWLPAIALGLFAGLTPALGAKEKEKPRGPNCSVASLNGSFGFYRAGYGPFGPLAAEGVLSFDGAGSWYQLQNISRNGEIFLDEEYSGSYTIASDCTGEIPADEGVFRFVIVDDGKGLYGVLLREGLTTYFIGTRIHR